MTAKEVCESRDLQRCIRELEEKLAYWQRQRETADYFVDKITERLAIVFDRQRELLQSKAAGA